MNDIFYIIIIYWRYHVGGKNLNECIRCKKTLGNDCDIGACYLEWHTIDWNEKKGIVKCYNNPIDNSSNVSEKGIDYQWRCDSDTLGYS